MHQQTGRSMREVVADFAELIAKAFFGGLGAAVLMALAILALSATARAAAPEALKSGALMLRADGEAVRAPLISTEIEINVAGGTAHTTVMQSFHNPGPAPAVAFYAFPLPAAARVTRVWARDGERVIEEQVREKERGMHAEPFMHSIGEVAPGAFVQVRLSYEQPLPPSQGARRLRVPLAAAPRYIPAGAPPDPMPDEPKALEARTEATPPEEEYGDPGCGAVNPVDIAITLEDVRPESITTSYPDAIVQAQEDGTTRVLLSKEQVDMDRDFVIAWTAPSAARKQGLQRAVLLTGTPRGDEPGSLAPAKSGMASDGAGALWANPDETGGGLHLVLGAAAVIVTGGIALLGRYSRAIAADQDSM